MIKLIDILNENIDESVVGDLINKIKSLPGNLALKKRVSQFNELEIKVFEYQNNYNGPINGTLGKYAMYFKSYCNKLGTNIDKLEDKELAKFLTKHYKQDLQPELSGVYKNVLLVHGGKSYTSLDVINIDKFLGTNMPNIGHFGSGFYLTNAIMIQVAKHYGGDIQPMIINNVQKPLNIRPGTKNYYGNTDFEGKEVIASVDIGKYINKDNYNIVAYTTGIPELDKSWEQNTKKITLKDLTKQIKERIPNISNEELKNILKNTKFKIKDSSEYISTLTGNPSLEYVYRQGKYDLIVTSKNTSGVGPDTYQRAEVVVLKNKASDVKSVFPSIEAILKSDGKKIERNLSSPNIHD